MNQSLQKIIANKKAIVFGSGSYALEIFPALKSTIYAVVDNDSNKWGSLFQGIEINPPEFIESLDKADIYILVASSYYQEISSQLQSMGFREGEHFCPAKFIAETKNVFLEPFEPGHFYSPIPSLEEIHSREETLFNKAWREIGDINLNVEGQALMLQSMKDYTSEFPYDSEAQAPELRYQLDNGFFGYQDALTLYAFMRHFSPKIVVEIGSGYSSSVMLDTNQSILADSTKLTFIEPYPDRLYSLMRQKDNAEVIASPLQDVPLELFETLEAGDILFVDSSHVSKIGSDVNRIFFDILPRLKPGVIIHFHDIFYPFEYPKEWLLMGRAWNEAYLLRAFLQNNDNYEILMWNHLLTLHHRSLFGEKFEKCLQHTGGSFWMRKKV